MERPTQLLGLFWGNQLVTFRNCYVQATLWHLCSLLVSGKPISRRMSKAPPQQALARAPALGSSWTPPRGFGFKIVFNSGFLGLGVGVFTGSSKMLSRESSIRIHTEASQSECPEVWGPLGMVSGCNEPKKATKRQKGQTSCVIRREAQSGRNTQTSLELAA